MTGARGKIQGATLAMGFLFFAGILHYHASQYHPFLADDALISLRYSARLLAGEGLTWTEGIPVEGYSNLLWVLLIALLGLLGLDLIDASRVLGYAGMLTVVASLWFTYARRDRLKHTAPAALVALFFVTLSTPIAVWTVGGLEQPLYAALLAVSIAVCVRAMDAKQLGTRQAALLSTLLGLLCLTRPDGPLFVVTMTFALFLFGIRRLGREVVRRWSMRVLAILGASMGFVAAQLVFRLMYYGEFLPNTARVKLAPSVPHTVSGFAYLFHGIDALAPFSYLAMGALLGLAWFQETRGKAVLLGAMLVSWGCYLVVIGGDIFPAYRHFVPIVVVLAFALAEGALLVTKRLHSPERLWGFALPLLCLPLCIPFGIRQAEDPVNHRALTERWEWDCKRIARTLKFAFGDQQPLLAVTAAGCLPYWSELPSLDMFGMNDHYLAHNPPEDFGDGYLGHELGSGQYVLDASPDLIVFDLGGPPRYKSGEELKMLEAFRTGYVPMRLKVEGRRMSSTVYVAKSSPAIGVQHSDDWHQVRIPAYLFQGEESWVALNDERQLVLKLAPEMVATLTLPNPTGREYHAQLQPPSSGLVRTELRQLGDQLEVTILTKQNDEVVALKGLLLHSKPH